MKIKVFKTNAEFVELDVEYPVYRKVDVSDEYESVFLTRADKDGTSYTIWKYADGTDKMSYQLEKVTEGHSYPSYESFDYICGTGEYECTQDEFDTALSELLSLAQEAQGRADNHGR